MWTPKRAFLVGVALVTLGCVLAAIVRHRTWPLFLLELAVFTILWAVIFILSTVSWRQRCYDEAVKEMEEEIERQRNAARVAAENEEKLKRSAEFCEAFKGLVGMRVPIGVLEGNLVVYYLNPAGALRSCSGKDYLCINFHTLDKPKVYLVKVWKREGYHEYYLRFTDGIQHWLDSFEEEGEWFYLSDINGDSVPLRVSLAEEPLNPEFTVEQERIQALLQFVTTYTSVADYCLKVMEKHWVPILLNMKEDNPNRDLAKLRVALQLKGKMFETGVDAEGSIRVILDRDPLKVKQTA